VSEYGSNYPQQQSQFPSPQQGGYPQQADPQHADPQQGSYAQQGLPQQTQYGNYPQQQAQYPTGESGIIGKRRNPFASWIGLPLITLGIYSFVWIYKTNKELSEFDRRIKVNPTLSVLAFFPGFLLLFIPPLVAIWRLGTRVQQAQRAAGVPECSPILAFILWVFISSTGVLYLQFEINKIWDRYQGAQQGQQVPLFA
jgi:hypothetical protein